MPRFRNSEIVSIIEVNFGGWVYGSRIAAIVEVECGGFCSHITLDSSGKMRPGIVAKSETKERMRVELQRLLRNDTFFVDTEFVSTKGRAEMLGELEAQLRQYRYEIRTPLDPAFGRVRQALTGKIGGKQDDLCIVTQMLALFPSYYFESRQRFSTTRFGTR